MSRWRGMYLQYSRRRPPRAARAVAGQDVPSRRWPRAQCSCARRVQLWLLRADAGVTGARKPPRQRRDETVSTHCRRLVRHGIPEEKWSPPFFRADPGQADCTQGRRLVLGCNLTPLVQSHTVPTTTIRCPPRCGRIARPCPDMYSVTVWLKRPAQSAPRAPLGGGGGRLTSHARGTTLPPLPTGLSTNPSAGSSNAERRSPLLCHTRLWPPIAAGALAPIGAALNVFTPPLAVHHTRTRQSWAGGAGDGLLWARPSVSREPHTRTHHAPPPPSTATTPDEVVPHAGRARRPRQTHPPPPTHALYGPRLGRWPWSSARNTLCARRSVTSFAPAAPAPDPVSPRPAPPLLHVGTIAHRPSATPPPPLPRVVCSPRSGGLGRRRVPPAHRCTVVGGWLTRALRVGRPGWAPLTRRPRRPRRPFRPPSAVPGAAPPLLLRTRPPRRTCRLR